jgi:UDP-N-acetylglucosamine--N-acetylmuramyl-(pentapeptide) pyrophosphoryl-undecaprenol N-acetylglucosamine transferase
MTSLGLPGILIPSPYVTNDHQTKNAQNLVDAGAVTMIKDAALTGETLIQAIDNILLNPETLAKMSASSKAEGVPNAAEKLYALAKEITKK